jgi:hypothetical protein
MSDRHDEFEACGIKKEFGGLHENGLLGTIELVSGVVGQIYTSCWTDLDVVKPVCQIWGLAS